MSMTTQRTALGELAARATPNPDGTLTVPAQRFFPSLTIIGPQVEFYSAALRDVPSLLALLTGYEAELTAHRIYNVLTSDAAAREFNREEFLQWFAQGEREGGREFRFCGSLGFGGKFWRNMGRWYVNCYREDATEERQRIIQRVNEKLERLRAAEAA